MEKRWEFEERQDKEKIQQLSESINVNSYIAEILLQRGITNFEEAKSFFRPELSQLHDPFLMKDLSKAVDRLGDAIFKNEKILIYGDYDVDGTTSVALVYGFLKHFSDHLLFYIPDRHKEGYGISEKGIRFAHENEVTLIIALDCGIKALDKADLAKELGIDLIICDHHLPGEVLPDAFAILDPKQVDCPYPYKELSGCGVGFKLLQGFCIQNTIDVNGLYQFLDLLAISIASDIVPITGENRVLAHYGIRKLNHSPSPGVKALMNVCGFKRKIDIGNIVFGIGPRINAAGRVGHAKEAVNLLIAGSLEEAEQFSEQIDFKNEERRGLDKSITAEAIEFIESDDALKESKSTVLYGETWHKGVIGIVASRCIERYYRPTIILTESNNKATGSARSVEGFDIYEAISECSDLLDQYGGHTHAAGLTMEIDQIPAFKEKFEQVVAKRILPEQLIPLLKADLEIPFSSLNYRLHNLLTQMGPFGPQNLEPIFVSRGVKLKSSPRVLKEEHLKLTLIQPGSTLVFEAIAFGLGYLAEEIESAESIDVAYHLTENEYLGNKSLQLMIKDIKPNSSIA